MNVNRQHHVLVTCNFRKGACSINFIGVWVGLGDILDVIVKGEPNSGWPVHR